MSKCKKPHPEEMQKLVGPLVELLTDSVHRTEGRRTDAFNHQKTVAEFLQALTWIAQGADAGLIKDITTEGQTGSLYRQTGPPRGSLLAGC